MSSVRTLLVGCGAVKRSMGWYHAKQLLEGRILGNHLSDIVEPFLLGAGKNTDDSAILQEWLASAAPDVKTHDSISGVEVTGDDAAYALIACRTPDMPALFEEVVEAGVKHVFLEKPGAPTVAELERMSELAKIKGVAVAMGYNKNVSKYVALAREQAASMPSSVTTFIHMNAYEPDQLDECFERNSEGMLKNMMIHELALLCTYYDVTVDNIAEVHPIHESLHSEERLINGKTYKDFTKIGFTVVTTNGQTISAKGDRCGGNFSAAEVAVGGEVKFTSRVPDPEGEVEMKALEAAYPGCMPYFYLQDADYIELKQRMARQILTGKPGVPEGMASIDTGLQALKLAEYLTPALMSK